MNKQQQTKLVITALAQQRDIPLTQAMEAITDDQLEHMISVPNSANDQLRQALMQSPALRRRLYFLADKLRAQVYSAWYQASVNTQLHYQAAASNQIEPITIDTNPDFTLTIFPNDVDGKRWTLHLQSAQRIKNLTPNGIQLVDQDGTLWMHGKLDDDGELSALWMFSDLPSEKLQGCTLKLQPC